MGKATNHPEHERYEMRSVDDAFDLREVALSAMSKVLGLNERFGRIAFRHGVKSSV